VNIIFFIPAKTINQPQKKIISPQLNPASNLILLKIKKVKNIEKY